VPEAVARDRRKLAHPPGEPCRRVHDGVPVSTGERREVAVAVSVQVLRFRKQIWIRPPAVEERDLVAALESCCGQMSAEEERAAKDENLHERLINSLLTRHS
jgi:hypothetical protein